MTVTRNSDGTVTLIMSEEDARNLVYVADDMAEVYEEVAYNSKVEYGDDPTFLQSVAHTLTEIAEVLFSVIGEE